MTIYNFFTGALQALLYDGLKSLWRRLSGREHVIYNGLGGIAAADVSGSGSQRIDANGKPLDMAGSGRMDVLSNGVVSLIRSNTAGKYEIRLNRLREGKDEREFLEPVLDRSKRSLTFSFQAKTYGGRHALTAIVCDADASAWLASETRFIEPADWQSHRVALDFDASRRVMLRFDDQAIDAGSSIQLRRLLITDP